MDTGTSSGIAIFLTLSIGVGVYAFVKAEKFDALMLVCFIFVVLLGAFIIRGVGANRD